MIPALRIVANPMRSPLKTVKVFPGHACIGDVMINTIPAPTIAANVMEYLLKTVKIFPCTGSVVINTNYRMFSQSSML